MMKIHITVYCQPLSWVLVLMLLIPAFEVPAFAHKSPYNWAQVQLDYIRQDRTLQLRRYITKLHQAARQAGSDKTVAAFFEMNRLYVHACKSQEAPPSMTSRIEQMRQHFNTHYIQNYLGFYDMLFVDIMGTDEQGATTKNANQRPSLSIGHV